MNDVHQPAPVAQVGIVWRVLRLYRHLTPQVLTAIALGALLGAFKPETAVTMKPLGDVFIDIIKLTIMPIILCTIVLGLAGMGDLKRVGRVGGKALLYFEIVTTFALAIGLTVVNITRPGAGVDVARLTKGAMPPRGPVEEFFAGINVLPVVGVALVYGVALSLLGARARPAVRIFARLSHVLFRFVGWLMYLAPIAAFGAMAFTVGKLGPAALLPLARLMLDVYLTMALFVFVVLNLICRWYGFRIGKLLRFIKEELLLVLGTSSSEAALPGMMLKMEQLGCSKAVVGLVIPAGYSFNLDGTSIYLSMAVMFLAQAFGVDLSLREQLGIMLIMMLTSKGAAGVTGSGLLVVVSTLGSIKLVPVEASAILLGVDRFMSEARAIVNLIGNGVATVVIAKSERAFDEEQCRRALAGEVVLDDPTPDVEPAVT